MIPLCASNDAPLSLRIPSECTISQQWFTATTTYEIMEKNQIVGTIRKHPLDFIYDFFDSKGASQASISMVKGIPQGYFILNDVAGNCVGDLREEGRYFHTYSIISPNGNVIAIATQNFWGTKFTILGPETNYHYATLSKYFLRKKWAIKIVDPTASYYQGIDPRLYTVLIVVEQDRSSWKRFLNNPNAKSVISKGVTPKSTQHIIELAMEANNIPEEDFEAVEAITEPMLSGITPEDSELALEILSPLLDGHDIRLTTTQKQALQLMIEARFE